MKSIFSRKPITYLALVQFFTTIQDTIFRFLVAYFLIAVEGVEETNKILAFTGAVFVLPFLLLTPIGGFLADRYSKNEILKITKFTSLILFVLANFIFSFQNHSIIYFILFLLTSSSAIYMPSKTGIIPEIVSIEKISNANSILTFYTFLATIIGTFLASFLLQITQRNFVISSLSCTIAAAIAFIMTLQLPKTPASKKKERGFFIGKEIKQAIHAVNKEPFILSSIICAAFVLFSLAIIQLNVIPYGIVILHLTDVEGGYLFLVNSLGMGLGAILAGVISGTRIELGIVPIFLFLSSLFCFILGFFTQNLIPAIVFNFFLGLFTGTYLVPSLSYIQEASPAPFRGKIIGLSNFSSFVFVLIATLFFYLITEFLHFSPITVFNFLGFFTLGLSIVFFYFYYDYVVIFFFGKIFSLFFEMRYLGKKFPEDSVIFFCKYTSLRDLNLILGVQNRRISLFFDKKSEENLFVNSIFKLLKVNKISFEEKNNENKDKFLKMKELLKKGYSIGIFVKNKNIKEEMIKFISSEFYPIMMKHHTYPVLYVKVRTGVPLKRGGFLEHLRKIRFPGVCNFEEPFPPINVKKN